MNQFQYAGLIVVSIMSILLFWKMICIEVIEKSLQNFFMAIGISLWTLFEMIGFVCGMGWSTLIIIYLYTMSGFNHKVSFTKWAICVKVSGVLTLTGFSCSQGFFPEMINGITKCALIQTLFFVYLAATVFGIIVYCASEDSIWEE
jgi:uncharacterized protein YacL